MVLTRPGHKPVWLMNQTETGPDKTETRRIGTETGTGTGF